MGSPAVSRARDVMTSTRMEAFSDGVIAVIITIMVLELHVPHTDGLAAIRDMAPHIGIYLLSFLLTGIYWLNHHELLRRTEHVDYQCLIANLIWLFVLSLIPLSTAYVSDKHFSSFAVAQYAAVNLLASATFGLLRAALLRIQRLENSLVPQDSAEVRKHLLSLLLMLLAIPAAYISPLASLLLTMGVVLLWIAPWLATRSAAGTSRAAIIADSESR